MIAEMAKLPGSNIFNLTALPQIGKFSEKTLRFPVWTAPKVDQAGLERIAKEAKEITALYNLGVAVGSSSSLAEVIQILHRESSRLINTSNFMLALYDGESDTLEFSLIFDHGEPVKPFSVKPSQSQNLLNRVLTTQTPLLLNDLLPTHPTGATNQAFASKKTQRVTRSVRSWLGVPILNPVAPHESAQGIIVTWSDEPYAFSEHDLWLLSAISTQAAIAIHHARLYEASQRRAAEMAHLLEVAQRQAEENSHLHATVLAERDRVLEAEEQARRKLATNLHDGPTQLVSALSLRLDLCKMVFEKEPDRLIEEVNATQELARQAVNQIRTMLFELRPLALETQGLPPTLQIFVERRQKEYPATKLTLNLETDQLVGEIARQDEKVEAALFAIAQETVNNALKHAQAENIVVHLKETSTALHLTINDDGQGFDVEQVLRQYEQRGSLGLINIWERAELIGAELTMHSTLGQGTRITLQVPKAQEERLKKRGGTGPLASR